MKIDNIEVEIGDNEIIIDDGGDPITISNNVIHMLHHMLKQRYKHQQSEFYRNSDPKFVVRLAETGRRWSYGEKNGILLVTFSYPCGEERTIAWETFNNLYTKIKKGGIFLVPIERVVVQ